VSAGPHPELETSDRWATGAGRLLADLGFSLVNGDDPDAPGGANLLVALREAPTLHHFDPELITYWRFDGQHGRLVELDRERKVPREQSFSWGRIRVTDRLQIENDYIAFGGVLRVADVDPTTRIVQFHARAPIFRWAGHSQGLDPLTDEVGAFFGRLMAPIDFQPGAEALVGQTEPRALYAAFVQDAWHRFAETRVEMDAEPELARWARHEGHRFETTEPRVAAAGRELRIALGLRRPD
jgi:hypothetical protein